MTIMSKTCELAASGSTMTGNHNRTLELESESPREDSQGHLPGSRGRRRGGRSRDDGCVRGRVRRDRNRRGKRCLRIAICRPS